MSFREKSAWINSVAILLVYGFVGLPLLHGPPPRFGAVIMLVVSTVLMIVITAAGHIAVAIRSRIERRDERDVLIDLRSSRYAYYVLGVGVWGLIYLAVVWPQPGLMISAALGVFVLAELVRFASQLVMYRLSA